MESRCTEDSSALNLSSRQKQSRQSSSKSILGVIVSIEKEKIWIQIVELHNHAKSLYLAAEEHSLGFKDFIQPNNEMKHALEHIIRAQAVTLGIADKKFDKQEEQDEYVEDCFRKALGHEYRSFFDSADWISVTLRSKIIEHLEPYSNACITNDLPDYYTKDKKSIDEINDVIAEIRSRKDIAKDGKLEEVKHYCDILKELEVIYCKTRDAVPSLNEFSKKEEQKTFNEKLWQILLMVLSALFGGLIGVFLGKNQ